MTRFAERSRGVKIQVLDLSSLEASALTFRRIKEPTCTKASIHGGKQAVGTTADGRVFLICTEGVGYEVTEDGGVEFEFHGNYTTDEPNVTKFDFMPFASIELSKAELLEYPVAEEVDLADHVRSFGARLEDNFWLWFKELS